LVGWQAIAICPKYPAIWWRKERGKLEAPPKKDSPHGVGISKRWDFWQQCRVELYRMPVIDLTARRQAIGTSSLYR